MVIAPLLLWLVAIAVAIPVAVHEVVENPTLVHDGGVDGG